MAKKRALVVGATGLIGKHCVALLLANRDYEKVIVLARRRSSSFTSDKLIEHIINFDQLSERRELLRADEIYCCLGSTMNKAGSKEAFYRIDFTYTLTIAELAVAADAAQFLLVSSIGADKNSSNFYLKVKGEIEAAVSALPFQAVQIMRPSLLVGEREEERTGERVAAGVSNLFSFIFFGPLKQYQPIAGRTVAQAMVNLAARNQRGVHIYNSDQIQLLAQSPS